MLRRTLQIAIASLGLGLVPVAAAAGTVCPPLPDLERSIDAAMAESMATGGIPGASLAVVRDGQVLISKGYGFADVDKQTPATGDTPFRVASLSKLLTATVVVQLAGQGHVDLHANIESYLGFSLDKGFAAPVSAHHLLTHTSGFEITDIADAARSADELLPLSELISARMVGQSHAPGEIYAYSNHGFALLGLLIERVTAQAFDQAVSSTLLVPLDMNRSSFAQPLPESISADVSLSYSADLKPLQRDFSQITPADGLVATADDMARFMVAQLAGHATFANGVLETMHAQQYAPYPTRYGMAYAWHETTHRGHRALEHSGGQLGFNSYMAIFPEENFGFFFSQNRRQPSIRSGPLDALLDACFERIVHDLPSAVEPSRDLTQVLDDYLGYYVSAEYPRHTFERLLYELAFLGRDVIVQAAPPCVDGGICRPDALAINSSKDRYYEIGKDVFQNASAWWVTGAFRWVPATQDMMLFLDRAAYEKRPPWRLPALQRLMLLLTLPIVLVGAVVWPCRARRNSEEPPPEKALRYALNICAAIGLLMFVLLALLLRIYATDDIQMDYEIRLVAYLLMATADLLKIAALAAAIAAATALTRRFWRPVVRVFAVLLSASMLYAAWLLNLSNVTLLH